LIRRCAEQSDRRDVVGDLWRQRPGDHIGRENQDGGQICRHGCALRVRSVGGG
jgi:hypothetical protein